MSTSTGPTKASAEVIYPDSDGQPMAENTLQFQWIVTIKEGLEAFFRDRDDVFVAGDLLWYPVEGQPEIRRAPDALVVFGRPKGFRGSYIQHMERGIAPQVVFEVLSPVNSDSEMVEKRAFYEQYGVEEYYQYDPEPGSEDLQGWIRRGDRLVRIEAIQGWQSPRLGLRFGLAGSDLVLERPDGTVFESVQQWDIDRLEQRQRAEEAEHLLTVADRRAEQERERAEQERRNAERERDRAERLAAQLRQLGIDPDTLP